MELEIYQAFVSAGVAEDKARAAAESVNQAIDKRYALHSQQLATRGDLAELSKSFHNDMNALRGEVNAIRGEVNAIREDISNFKVEIMKWKVGSMLASVGLFATITKLWH